MKTKAKTKNKYPINEEFHPYSKIHLPFNRLFLSVANALMRPPRSFMKDKELKVEKTSFDGYKGAKIEALIITPVALKAPSPCLIYYHGGGFVSEAAWYHYRLVSQYAKRVGCKVVFVKYRLAPKYKFPTGHEDCYLALDWVYRNAEELGVDLDKIAVGGDSAGGNLSAAVSMMARDREHPIKLSFQMLIYPFLDGNMNSESSKQFVDTPMWNTRRSMQVVPMVLSDGDLENLHYLSIVEASHFCDLPPAYIETAEFDSIRDDGIKYAELLGSAGVRAELWQTKGTMHAFDVATNAPTTVKMINSRIAFMQKAFAAG